MTDTKTAIREAAEADLVKFVQLVHPMRVLGDIHKDVANWWQRPDAKSHQLLLLPRDHMKSALLGYRCAQRIVKQPSVRILYVSATERLATKQLKFIKDILLSEAVRYYWPELIELEENQREKWTETEIAVDDPRRAAEAVRDPTILAAGLTTNLVGLHCDVAAFDDVVVPENVSSKEARDKVAQQYGYLSSIEGTDSEEWVVGTHYDPNDLYAQMKQTELEIVDSKGDIISNQPMYDIFERVVEDSPDRDGTGSFLWPRQMRESDGKTFGFNAQILAKKRAAYRTNLADFYAQYYNDPNARSESGILKEFFQYYEPSYIRQKEGYWTFQGRRLNVSAAIDFAFSTKEQADWSCLAVTGVDPLGNYFILDLRRFKTSLVSDYFKEILRAHEKWSFRKLRAEVVQAQLAVVRSLKEDFIRPLGVMLAVEEYLPSQSGPRKSKVERINSILKSKYEARQIWHNPTDPCTVLLEDELVKIRPAHDDIKDAVASAIDASFIPAQPQQSIIREQPKLVVNSRFGGLGPIR
jgi:hypothetical protein